VARLSTAIKDVETDQMEQVELDLLEKIDKLFPKERYNVMLTGKALLFLKGTKYLIKNLIMSLALAIFLIALFMALPI
jgi:predicted RND superfamily exporter protein